MATKKFIIEVEEGRTKCGQCPDSFPCGGLSFLHCCDYNLATMKIKEKCKTMKARVLKNGRIVDIYPKEAADYAGRLKYIEKGKGLSYYEDELDFIDYSEQPDYWEKLKHQYAGMAMQGFLSNSAYLENFVKYSVEGESFTIVVTENAVDYATALVNRLKEDSQCEE